jgi:teichuronic acid exporter
VRHGRAGQAQAITDLNAGSLKRRAAHATWWSAIEISARYGAQFIVMLVLARMLAPSAFGLVAMVLVFTSLAAILVDSGFSTALIQKQAATTDDETTVFAFCIVAGVGIGGMLALAAPWIAGFYQQPVLADMTRALSLTLPMSALAAVPDAKLSQQLEFRARAAAEVCASLLAGATALVLAWRGFGVWSIVWQSLVSVGARTVLLWLYSGWRPRGRVSMDSLRSLSGFGGYMLLSNLLDVATLRVQSLLIGRLFDSRALGLYTVAQNTQQAPTSLFGSILARVGLPVFSTVSTDPVRLRGALRVSMQASMFLFVPSMVGLALAAEPLMGALYGDTWRPAAPILSLLALSAVCWPMHVLNLAAINAQGRSDLFFKLELLKKAVAIALILTASRAGPVAIAGSTVVASVFAVVVNTHYTRTLLGYGLLAQCRDQAATALLTCAAAAMGWCVMHFLPAGPWPTILAVAAGGTIYLGGAIALRVQPWRELRALGGELWSSRRAAKVRAMDAPP